MDKTKKHSQCPAAAGEDTKCCFRTNELGYRIKHIPEMIVQHHYGYNGNSVKSWRAFVRQFRKYGMGERVLLGEVPGYYAWFERTVEIGVIVSRALASNTQSHKMKREEK